MGVEIGVSVIDASATQTFQQINAQGGLALERGAKRATDQYKHLNLSVKQLYRETRTPAEQHNRRMGQLNKLLKTGKIDQDLFNRSAKKSAAEMRRADLAAGRLGRSLKQAHKSGAEMCGQSALSNIKNLALRWGSVATAIAGISTAFREAQAAAREAAQKGVESRMGVGSLAQVATSKEDFARLRSQSEELFKAGGAQDLNQAARVIFQLRSAGLDDPKSRKLFAEMRATGLMAETEELAVSVKSLATAMGTKETGDTAAIISKALGASGGSPAKATALLTAAARGGMAARHLGFSDEALLVATASISNVIGRPELAGTRVESYLTALFKKGEEIRAATGGTPFKSFMGSVQRIQSLKLSDKELITLLGRKEAAQAFLTLSQNPQAFEKSYKDVVEAQRHNIVMEKLSYHRVDPSSVAARQAEAARAAEETSRTELGTAQNIATAHGRLQVAKARESGVTETEIVAMKAMRGVVEFVVGPERLNRIEGAQDRMTATGKLRMTEIERQNLRLFAPASEQKAPEARAYMSRLERRAAEEKEEQRLERETQKREKILEAEERAAEQFEQAARNINAATKHPSPASLNPTRRDK